MTAGRGELSFQLCQAVAQTHANVRELRKGRADNRCLFCSKYLVNIQQVGATMGKMDRHQS